MTAFALILCAAAVGFGLSRWLHLPAIPFLLLAGWILGVLGQSPEDEGLRGLLELGVTVLVFISGVELNPARFAMHRKPVIWISLVQFVLVGLIGFGVTTAMGFDPRSALYLGLGLSASSTLVVVPHLKRQQQMFEPFGRTVTGVLLLQDVAMILAIVLISKLDASPWQMLASAGAACALGVLAYGFHRVLMPWLVERLKLDEERLLLSALGVLFLFLGLAEVLGLPLIAGAFCAGFCLSSSPTNGATRGLLGSLSDFFLAIFFTALGASIQRPDAELILQALALAGLVFLVTPPLVTLVGEWKGLTARAAIESGLLLAQASEFSLVLGLTGLYLGHIDERLFTLIALVTAITIGVTPFVATDAFTWKLLHFHPSRRKILPGSPPEGHVLVLGFGTGGMWMVKPLLAEGLKVLVVDDDPAIIAQLRRAGIDCLRGDGSDARILERAGAKRARVILASMRRVTDAHKVLRFAPGVKTLVRVFEQADAEKIRALGGMPVLNSEAAADTLMEWLETRRD